MSEDRDQLSVQITEEGHEEHKIDQFIEARYDLACEAVMRIMRFGIVRNKPTVV